MSTYTVSPSRAGVGAVVVQDDPSTARTVNVANVGVVQTAATSGGGGATDTRVVILA
jgi:hypothetical protein